jgi:hypothetical protein
MHILKRTIKYHDVTRLSMGTFADGNIFFKAFFIALKMSNGKSRNGKQAALYTWYTAANASVIQWVKITVYF